MGDAVARPLLDAWDRAADAGEPYDVSSLFSFSNGGAPMSPATPRAHLRHAPARDGDRRLRLVRDRHPGCHAGGRGGGAAAAAGGRGGAVAGPLRPARQADHRRRRRRPDRRRGRARLGRGRPGARQRPPPARLPQRPREDRGDVRRARRRAVARHRRHGDGRRRRRHRAARPGLGRINTGGEKVFPEEVESALKAHPAVYDCLVVGVPDERWGSAVTAVVQPSPGAAPDARRPGRPLQGVARRLQGARSTSWSSTRSSAHRRARPTTAGPSETAEKSVPGHGR